jgi:hypothetical protein
MGQFCARALQKSAQRIPRASGPGVEEGAKAMTTRWLNTSGGEAPYYQDGDCLYSKEGKCKFSVSAGWRHDIKTGKPAFYVADNWVYSAEGKPICYFE